jgi:hypothetical protein
VTIRDNMELLKTQLFNDGWFVPPAWKNGIMKT